MKHAYRILTLVMVLLTAWSCGEEDNLDALGEWELGNATPTTPASNQQIVLNEAAPAAKTTFEWNAAQTTNRFLVQYSVVLVPAESENYDNPLLTITPGNAGKNLFAEVTAQQIDYALWVACYPPDAVANLKWAVVSKAIEKKTVATQAIAIKRFATEYKPETLFITGSATEKGVDPVMAIPMRSRVNEEGDPTYVFDVYTTLTKGATYQFRDQANASSKIFGGQNGTLEGCGAAIAVEETAQYRITVDLNANTYSLLKIDRWSLVGGAVEGGWGGDVPLAYKGNGTWEGVIEFLSEGDFIYRANENWDYIIKRIVGTATSNNSGGKVLMESEQGELGVTVENVPTVGTGRYTVTLNLAADAYTYGMVVVPTGEPAKAIIGETANPSGDAVSGNFVFGTYTAPDELYLVSDGSLIATFTKDGSTFTSTKFFALQESKKYILNSKNDGSGTTYNNIGDGTIAVARDQAYQLNINFATGKLAWKYYNMKLFHWDDANGGWDARAENVMTYTHPYKFDVTAPLTAGFDSKFNSPWAVQFGTAATALSGTMNNVDGGPNFKGIVQTGTYKASIEVADDFTSCTYSFVKQ